MALALPWDIYTGRDGTQGFFTADNAGIKSVEAVVSHVRSPRTRIVECIGGQ